MGYPKHMYKGSYTAHALNAQEQIVLDEKQEQVARKRGFIDGHEFFSRPAAEPKSEFLDLEKRVKESTGKFDANLGSAK